MHTYHITRRQLTLAGVAGLGALAFASTAQAQTKWNLPGAYAAGNFHSENLVEFAKDVSKATGGKLEITVHANASLFKAPEIKRATATGQTQMGEVLISLHENEDPVFGIDVVPFLATSFKDARKLWEASKPATAKKLASQGLMVLFAVPWPPQGIYANKELNSVEDMKGLKWRAYNVGTSRIGEMVGAQSVTLQASDLPAALATGVVNSYMSSGATGYDTKTWESISHFYDVQAWIPKNVTFVNKAAFDALDKPTQDALLAAAKVAEDRGWKIAEEKTTWYLKELAAKGMKTPAPSAALTEGFKKIGAQLTADWLKRAGAAGEEIVAAYRK